MTRHRILGRNESVKAGRTFFGGLLLLMILGYAGSAMALPSLQLGPDPAGDWTYDLSSQTWVTSDNPLTLLAYANATTADSGNGDYAWDAEGATTQTAYLVVSAIPKINFDGFDVTVVNDAVALAPVTSGYGTPPIEDSNSLASHGIWDTWYEIYAFNFDGALTMIENTQPPGGDPGMGYAESFMVTYSLDLGVDAIHFDLFTVTGDGQYVPGSASDHELVKSFAPYSHDAVAMPEPNAALAFGVGLALVSRFVRRRR